MQKRPPPLQKMTIKIDDAKIKTVNMQLPLQMEFSCKPSKKTGRPQIKPENIIL